MKSAGGSAREQWVGQAGQHLFYTNKPTAKKEEATRKRKNRSLEKGEEV